MKRNAKLALICFSMCSLFAFTEAKAQVEKVAVQEIITDTFYVEDLLEGVEEVAVEENSSSKDLSRMDFYMSFLTMDQNSAIGNALNLNMPQQGIGCGYNVKFNITDYFTPNLNFGYNYGIRNYTLVPENEIGLDKRAYSHTIYSDISFGGQMYFSKNHKNGLNISAGFGYDYGELHIATAEPGKVMVANQKIIQHGFYVPVGITFFFGEFSIGAVYRWRAFDIDMTVESLNEPLTSPINRNETLKMFPLEIRLGVKL
ncbi:MAG: hypothetical protein UH077_05025 [Bacteroidales bacterium]|nr:hypothetical protein [Bacteroidales bacterium]